MGQSIKAASHAAKLKFRNEEVYNPNPKLFLMKNSIRPQPNQSNLILYFDAFSPL